MRKGIWLCILLALTATVVLADEEIRQVQEALRKRNLYFSDINGQASPELGNAVKRYQARKGFPATGEIDDLTARSLNVEMPGGTAGPVSRLPDEPVLKSDLAPQLPEEKRIALQKQAEDNPDQVPT